MHPPTIDTQKHGMPPVHSGKHAVLLCYRIDVVMRIIVMKKRVM